MRRGRSFPRSAWECILWRSASRLLERDAERPGRRSHAERGNDHACTACNRLERKSLGDTSNCFLNERLKCAESVKPHL